MTRSGVTALLAIHVIIALAAIPIIPFLLNQSASGHMTGTCMQHRWVDVLSLYHGGFKEEADVVSKPNYLSLMHGTFLYDIPMLDFSGCELAPLDERNLSEPDGIGPNCPAGHHTAYYYPPPGPHHTHTGIPVDWNGDGDVEDQNIIADINKDGQYTVLHGHDDWSSLKFEKVVAIPSAAAVEENLGQEYEPDHSHDFSGDSQH